jgi:thioredoxin 1
MRKNWLRALVVLISILVMASALTVGNAANDKNGKQQPKPVTKQLPKLLDLGATKCIPCKMMVPVLDGLAKDYKGQLEVEFIDVWKDQKAAEKYNVKSIPTQIFFDAKGKEFFRHVGYFPKEDIVKAFQDHGIKLKKPVDPKKPQEKK